MRVTWLLDGRLGASGMLYPRDLEELRREGISAVVSLTIRDPLDSIPKSGIAHLHLPIPDMSRPARSILAEAVAFLRAHLDEGGRVVVHCGAGLGRTGTVLACYLAAHGRSAEEAIRTVRDARPGSIETRQQEQAVRDFHAEFEGGRDE